MGLVGLLYMENHRPPYVSGHMGKSFQPELPGVTGEDIPAMSDDELRKFVDDLVSGRVFTHHQVLQESMIPMVFMPIALGALKWSDTGFANIGAIWEYMDQAGPRSINGYPMFTSLRLMNANDWETARVAAEREIERRRKIEL